MKSNIGIRLYEPKDENALFRLMEREGDQWKDYWHGVNRAKYKKALASSATYLLFVEDELCGFARCRDDDGSGYMFTTCWWIKASGGTNMAACLWRQYAMIFPTRLSML